MTALTHRGAIAYYDVMDTLKDLLLSRCERKYSDQRRHHTSKPKQSRHLPTVSYYAKQRYRGWSDYDL